MKRKNLVFTIIIVLVAVSVFFYPKKVGGPLCGPVCHGLGLHYFEQACLGFVVRYTAIDWYADICYGLPIGEVKCYGIPYTDLESSRDMEIDCNYPCSDEEVRSMCTNQESIDIVGITIDCNALKTKCNW